MNHLQFNIRCPYEIIDMGGIDVAVFCYVSAYSYNGVFCGTIIVNANQIADDIGVDASEVDDALKRLCDSGLFNMRKSSIGTYRVEQDSVFATRQKFIMIDFDDVQRILHSDNQSCLKLLHFYTLVLKTVNLSVTRNNVRGFVNDKSLEYFAKAMGTNSVTISRYEKALEELGIFYILHAHGKAATNLIGLKKYQSLIDAYAIDAGILQRFSSTNQNVSILQKYNALCRGVEYSDKEVLDIYNGVVSYNKDHPNKARDLTVFEKYQITLDNVS